MLIKKKIFCTHFKYDYFQYKKNMHMDIFKNI